MYWPGTGAQLRRGLSLARAWLYLPAMPFPAMPDPAAERERDEARRHPERDTLLLAAAGAAQVLGPYHGVTKALAKAAITMSPAPPRPPGRHARRRRSAGYSRIVGAHLTFDHPTLYRCGRSSIAASL